MIDLISTSLMSGELAADTALGNSLDSSANNAFSEALSGALNVRKDATKPSDNSETIKLSVSQSSIGIDADETKDIVPKDSNLGTDAAISFVIAAAPVSPASGQILGNQDASTVEIGLDLISEDLLTDEKAGFVDNFISDETDSELSSTDSRIAKTEIELTGGEQRTIGSNSEEASTDVDSDTSPKRSTASISIKAGEVTRVDWNNKLVSVEDDANDMPTELVLAENKEHPAENGKQGTGGFGNENKTLANGAVAYAANTRTGQSSDSNRSEHSITLGAINNTGEQEEQLVAAQERAALRVENVEAGRERLASHKTDLAPNSDTQHSSGLSTSDAARVDSNSEVSKLRAAFETASHSMRERIEGIAAQLATRLRISHAAGGSEVNLNLKPRELGEVAVKMSLRDGVVAATILVERPETLRTMQTHLDDLKRSLEAQGLKIDEFSVDVRSDSFKESQQQAQSGGSRHQAAPSSSTSHDESDSEVTPGLTSKNIIDAHDAHDGEVSLVA